MFKLSPNGKDMTLAPMEYGPSGKDIMVPMENTPMVYSTNGKVTFLSKIIFRRSNGHGKR